MNSYLATLILLLIFVLRFMVPLAIVIGLGYFISLRDRRRSDETPIDGSPLTSA